jgi:hypothetical protein
MINLSKAALGLEVGDGPLDWRIPLSEFLREFLSHQRLRAAAMTISTTVG